MASAALFVIAARGELTAVSLAFVVLTVGRPLLDLVEVASFTECCVVRLL